MEPKYKYYITIVCSYCGEKTGIVETQDPEQDGSISHTVCRQCLVDNHEDFGLTAEDVEEIIRRKEADDQQRICKYEPEVQGGLCQG